MSKILQKAFAKVPLKSRLYVMNSMAMIDAIVEAGYREDKGWEESEDEQLRIINECARKLTENQFSSLVSYINRDAPTILFIGHCDVVPAGPGWKTDPFSLKIAGDKAYGRGSADMKGAVSIMLSLAEYFKEESKCSVVYAINLDEESGGKYGAGNLMKIFN